MTDLAVFRDETRNWLEENCPPEMKKPMTPHGMLLPPREPAAGMLVNPLIRGLDHGVDNSHQNNYKNSRPLPRGSQPPHGGRGVPVSSPPRVAPVHEAHPPQINAQFASTSRSRT